ncbi:MAG: molecular chaperone TorD family protein [Thalassovita sp.]
MSDQHVIPRHVAYRWLAQFFLCPPDLTTLESYHSQDGQQFLTGLQSTPALDPLAGWLKDAVTHTEDLVSLQAQIARAFTQTFDMGGPRAALPYASVYLSAKGLLFQQPARDMNALLQRLQMQLPAEVNEPTDHLGVQLHVAAELIERESLGQSVPISSTAFLDQQVLSWLAEFVQRCEALIDRAPIPMLAQAALALAQETCQAADLCREPM